MRHRSVREIMRADTVCALAPQTTVREASRAMARSRVSSVPVIEAGRLVGIFTERDLVQRVLAEGRDPDRTRLGEVMTPEPDTVGPFASVDDAIRMMDEFGYRHLPVVDGERVIGMVSLRDCSIDDLAAMRMELEDRHAFAERAW